MKFTSNTVKKAWAIRKEAAKEIGCKVSEVVWSICLEMAAEPETALVGSEKQIAWAKDIKNDKKLDFVVKFVSSTDEIPDENKDIVIGLIQKASSEAKFWIESRGLWSGHSDNFDIDEDKRTGLKMASSKCRKIVENVIENYYS